MAESECMKLQCVFDVVYIYASQFLCSILCLGLIKFNLSSLWSLVILNSLILVFSFASTHQMRCHLKHFIDAKCKMSCHAFTEAMRKYCWFCSFARIVLFDLRKWWKQKRCINFHTHCHWHSCDETYLMCTLPMRRQWCVDDSFHEMNKPFWTYHFDESWQSMEMTWMNLPSNRKVYCYRIN